MAADNLIDGRAIAEQIHQETAHRVAALKQRGVQPGLVFVRVGDDPASKVYVGMKEKTSARLGIDSKTHVLPETTTEGQLLELISRLNADASVHGILVQAPLPRHISETRVYATVSPQKDVDGFHPMNVGKLMLGDTSGFLPCTPAGVHQLLIRSMIKTVGAEVVVLGRGNIVGKPMAAILIQKDAHADATVTICHSRTRNIADHCRRADILIAALGAAEFVNRVSAPAAKGGSKLGGDVDLAAVQPIAGRITPNPGGVGPMTIAMLMHNTVRAAELLVK